MRINNFNKVKDKSGITMVALVITVAVLIIVSSIAIMSLTGDDGSIEQAKDAKSEALYKQAKSEVNEEWFTLQNDERKNDNSNEDLRAKLQERLRDRQEDEEKTKDASVEYDQANNEFNVTFNGQKNIILALDPTVPEGESSVASNITATNPNSIKVLEETEAVFSTTASLPENVELTYQWYKKNNVNQIGSEKIQGATQSTYSIPHTTKDDDDTYYFCEISAKYNGLTENVKTEPAKLDVISVIKGVVVTPEEQTVAKGKTINLHAEAIGTDDLEESTLTYIWYSTATDTNTGGTVIEGYTGADYEKQGATRDDDHYYYCVATQTYGSSSKTLTSNTVKVNVIEPEITYDYQIEQNYPAGTYTDTGYNINWDNDFTIEATVNIPELGKNYLVIGGSDGNSALELNIEITETNQLKVYYGTGGHTKTAGTISANEDIVVKFKWNATAHSYEITAVGANTNITISDSNINNATAETTGDSINTLKIGCNDETVTSFNPISIKTLKITEVQEPNGILRLPTVERLGWTFNGWYTEATGGTQITEGTKVPTTEATYYAQYSDPLAPEIISATPSTTLDTSNYVDFTAIDHGTGITGYNITSVDEMPSTWIPVIDAVEEHTETKYQYDAAWARVFHHNNHWEMIYFSNEAEAKSADTIDKYSVLGNLENYNNNNNKYEFLLQYPEKSMDNYNRWVQDDNPTTLNIPDTENGQQVPGYIPMHIDWSGYSFGGLAKSNQTTNTLLDGSTGSYLWTFAVGAYHDFGGGMPGPSGYSSHQTSIVNLWARIDEKTVATTNNLTRRLGDLTENRTYYIWVKDTNGNVGSKAIEINKVDTEKPIAEITSTNNVASSQTATLTMGDNNGVVEYYWGTSNPSQSNVTWINYNNSTSASEEITVNSESTYYLGVKDFAGNITVVSKTFYKTTLNPGSATVDPATVITPQGESVDLPNPTEVPGYDFNGWFTEETAGTLITNPYTPTGSTTLYAHYTPAQYTVTFDPNGGSVDPTSKTVTYGQSYGELPTPIREEYEFLGWTNDLIIGKELSAGAISSGIYFDFDGYIHDSSPDSDGRNTTNEAQWNWKLNLSSGTYTLSLDFKQKSTQGDNHATVKNMVGDAIAYKSINNVNSETLVFTLTENSTIGIVIKGYNGVYRPKLEKISEATGYFITESSIVQWPDDHTLTAVWRDNTPPTVTYGNNGNTIPSTTASTPVTVTDLGSGPKESSFKYLWTTRESGVTLSDFTGSNSGTFVQGGTVTFPPNNSGDYYLYIYAEDNAGNSVVAKSNVFIAGNIPPGALTSANDTWNNTGTTITIDAYAIRVTFDDNNVRSEAHDIPSVAKITVNGEELTINNGHATYLAPENGLYTIEVTDKYGNTWSEGKNIGNVDTTPPTINATDISFGQVLNIGLADVGSGVNGWQVTSSSSVPTDGWTPISPATLSTSVTKSGLTAGTWYIWAKDVAGNIGSKQIHVYSQATTITVNPPGEIICGNSATCSATVSPAINGTWTVTSSNNVVDSIALSSNYGTSTNITYRGARVGDATITVVFTPEDASYGTTSTQYIQTVIPGNYSITSGATKTYYNTMASAVAAVPNNNTRTIVQELDCTDPSIVAIGNGKNVTFNNNGKNLTKTSSGITINDGAYLTVSGSGNITTSENISLLSNSGQLNITHTGTISSTYTGNNYLIYNQKTFSKSGSGTLTSKTSNATITNLGSNASATISAGNVNHNSGIAINSYGGSSVTIQNSARIEAPNGIYLGSSSGAGGLEITGGAIVGTTGYGVSCNNSSTANITSGTVTGKTKGIELASGTVNVGNISSSFSKTDPAIQGDTYGLQKTGGTWNFYNGIIKGKTNNFTGGNPTVVRTGYGVKHDTEGAYKTAYLKLLPTLTVPQSATVTYGQTVTVSITYTGDGTLSVSSANSNITTGRISGRNLIITGVNFGVAKLTVTASEGNNYLSASAECEVTVGKADLNVVDNTAPVTYDGNPHGISLSITPSTGTTIWYSSNSTLNANNKNSVGSKTPITRTNVGSQTVYWYVDPGTNTNYNGITGHSTIVINRANINPTVSMSNYQYGGTKANPSISGNLGNGTVTYYYNRTNSNQNGTAWTSVTSATSLNAGDYYMYATVGQTTNYNSATTPTTKFTVTKKTGSLTLSKSSTSILKGNTDTVTITYTGDGTSFNVTSSNTTIATVSRSNNTITITAKNTGTATITVSAVGETNYTTSPATCNVTVEKPNYQISAGSPTYHKNIDTAISNLTEGGTITVLEDYSDSSTATLSKNATLDLNGKTLTRTSIITVNSNKTVTITGAGTLTTSSAINLISNAGTLNLTHTGTISNTNTGNYNVITNTGTVNQNGSGQISSGTSGCAISGGRIYVTAGTVSTSKGKAISTADRITISGGTVRSTYGDAVYLTGSTTQTMSMTGGTIEKSGTNAGYAIDSASKGSINITGGTVQNTSGTYSTIINTNGSTITINGSDTKIINLNGMGIYNISGGGTINVIDGTVSATQSAIYNKTDTACKINIGIDTEEGDVAVFDMNSPVISSNTYGVCADTGTFNIYKGIIKGGNTRAYAGTVSNTRSGYTLTTGTEGTYNTAYLRKEITLTSGNSGVVKLDTHEYYSYNPSFSFAVSPSSTYISSATFGSNNGYEVPLTIQTQANKTATTTIFKVKDQYNKQTEVAVHIQTALYELSSYGSNLDKYHITMSNAIDAVASGGTIKVLKSYTDDSDVEPNVNKNVTIDTNGNTLTMNKRIAVTSNKLTVTGNGTMDANRINFYLQGGSLDIKGASSSNKVTITSDSYCISGDGDTSGSNNKTGTVNIENAYVSADGYSTVQLYGGYTLNIKNAYIYTPNKDKCAIYLNQASLNSGGTLTIEGESYIGNAGKNQTGTNPDSNNPFVSAIACDKWQTVTIKDESRVCSGPEGEHAITMHKGGTLNVTGNARLFACKNNTDVRAIMMGDVSGDSTLTLNTGGWVMSRGKYVATCTKSSDTMNITKGNFVCKKYSDNTNNRLFLKGTSTLSGSGYEGTANKSGTFRYMDAYNSSASASVSESNCIELKKNT